MKEERAKHDLSSSPLNQEHDKYTKFSPRAIAKSRTLTALLAGRKMSVVELTTELRMPDPRSAIRYLRNAGVPISDVWVKSRYSRYKLYFIHQTEESEVNNG